MLQLNQIDVKTICTQKIFFKVSPVASEIEQDMAVIRGPKTLIYRRANISPCDDFKKVANAHTRAPQVDFYLWSKYARWPKLIVVKDLCSNQKCVIN